MAKIRRIYVSLHTRSNNGRMEAFAGGSAFQWVIGTHKCKRNLLSFKVAKRLFRGKSPCECNWKQTKRFVAAANVKMNEDAAMQMTMKLHLVERIDLNCQERFIMKIEDEKEWCVIFPTNFTKDSTP